MVSVFCFNRLEYLLQLLVSLCLLGLSAPGLAWGIIDTRGVGTKSRERLETLHDLPKSEMGPLPKVNLPYKRPLRTFSTAACRSGTAGTCLQQPTSKPQELAVPAESNSDGQFVRSVTNFKPPQTQKDATSQTRVPTPKMGKFKKDT